MAIIDDIQSQIYERRTAAAWKSINEFCGRKSTPLICNKASSIDEVNETLQRHYANRPPPFSPKIDDDYVATVSPELDLPEVTGPITTSELRAALFISKLSSSSDGFPVIALRIEEFEDYILDSINQSLTQNTYIPYQWKHSIIASMPKNGSSISLDNQRGIAKSCATSKIRKNSSSHDQVGD